MTDFVETHIAGDTLDFKVSVPDYPSLDGWTLKYRLTPRFSSPAQTPIDISAIANADGSYQVQAGPAATSVWKTGFYTWARWVEKSGARQTLTERGQLEIRPNPATSAQGDDTRTFARKMVDAVEAMLASRATQTQRELVSYTIGSRGQTFDPNDRANLVKELSFWRWQLSNEDAREKMAAGLPNPRSVGIRFGR